MRRVIGADGASLLYAIYDAKAPLFLREISSIEILRQVWVQNYTWREGKISWRSSEDIPPAARYRGSPYDTEAHYSKMRSPTWVGYKVHLTETCEKESPHLITHVETTSAPGSDDARLLVEGQRDYELELIGPTRANYRWQTRDKTGFDASQFLIDWQAEQATCPEGHTSRSWTPAIDNRTNEVIKIKFSTKDCQTCSSLRLCTQSIRHVRRTVTIRPKERYDGLQARRQFETTKDFKTLYAIRAGVEGTISQGVRTMGLRRSRYSGQERTHLQHVATAAAINVVRLMR